MNSSRQKQLADLRRLQRKRRALLQRLTQNEELAVGTVAQVYRKCGNPRCHCLKGRGHLQTLFLFKDAQQGRRRCKLVRREDESRLILAGERYRELRKNLMLLYTLNLEEKRILMALARGRAIVYK